MSNVHRDGFAGSNRRLHGDFAAIITAEDVGAYKPAPNHFRALDATLVELGLDRRDLLHVAQSLFHDHVPAKREGLPSVWINRRHDRPGWGATPSRRVSGPTTWSSPPWRTSPTPQTGLRPAYRMIPDWCPSLAPGLTGTQSRAVGAGASPPAGRVLSFHPLRPGHREILRSSGRFECGS